VRTYSLTSTAFLLTLLTACASQGSPTTSGSAATRTQNAARASGFTRTSTSEEVLFFLHDLAKQSAKVRIREIGKSAEGRAIPLAILADPPVASYEEARKSGKLVVSLLGNIHGGEVDGKEALLELAQSVATAASGDLLKNVILCLIPNYNPDGNDRLSAQNRREQGGPHPVGARENAAGLDLNRDFVKAEAPETQALLRFLRAWDPAVFVDAHTTNGSLHRNLVTYAGPKHPAGDRRVIQFVRERMLPDLQRTMSAAHGISTGPYGFYSNGRTQWVTFPDEPRFGTNYVGLRNRISILCESYSYASFEDRVRGSRAFLQECVNFASSHAAEIRTLISEADSATASAANSGGSVALRTEVRPFEKKIKIPGYREGEGADRGEPLDLEVSLVDDFKTVKSSVLPRAYLLPSEMSAAAELLQRHGIPIEVLREDLDLTIERSTVEKCVQSPQEFQKHKLLQLEVSRKAEVRRVRAGSFVVRTANPLGVLASYLLEPESEDGLHAWGLLGERFEAGVELAVLRVPNATAMLTTAYRPLAEDRTLGKRVTFEILYERADPPPFQGGAHGIDGWCEDGEHFLQRKEGRMWKVNAASGAAELFGGDAAEMARALEKVSPAAAKALRDSGGATAVWNTSRDAVFFEHANDLYYCRTDGQAAARLTQTPDTEEEVASFSPDGKLVAFVRSNNLFLVDVSTQQEKALTTGGHDRLRFGKADWVYFEELFNRSWKAYWWSPDSKRIAWLRSDSAAVPTYTLVNDVGPKLELEAVAYPRVGEPNPVVDVQVGDVDSSAVRTLELTAYAPKDRLITAVGWWSDGASLFACVQNREQTWLDLMAFRADQTAGAKLLRDSTQAWIESPQVKFLEDGSFLLTSERTGWQHLYRYSRDGALRHAVTSGDWEVQSIERVDEKNGFVYFVGTKDDPIAPHLYRARLDGSGVERLTKEPGAHTIRFSPRGPWIMDTVSRRDATPRTELLALDGAPVRTLDSNPVYVLEEYQFGTERYVEIPCPDGGVIPATLLLPADFDPSRKYPVWFKTYGGPHAPTIAQKWDAARPLEEALVNSGILVFRADPRSASGRGAVSAWRCYKNLGVPELADVEIAIRWLVAQHPFVDAGRIGMEGHSFGGFLTAYALTHSELFASGIAGAPVTDWRLYDSIYTERYMLTPERNAQGYESTSVLAAAKHLRGKLLLLHGWLDDNVHPQNSTQLIQALQTAGKQFEFMAYPQARHGIRGKHYQRLKWDFIQRSLRAAG